MANQENNNTVETTEPKVELKTVGFVALDEKGNPITGKIYNKRSTAKGLETKAENKRKEEEAKRKEEKLKKRLENAVKRLNNRLG